MSLLNRLRDYAATHAMWRHDTRVLAAVSGGSDSVAMLLLLHELHLKGELQLVAAVHLNHQVRPEADDDEAFCVELTRRLGVPFESSRVDVPALARTRKQSIELAGRNARRMYFDESRRALSADVVALAHTADDQAETVLMRLLRGSGLRGLSGMAPRGDHRVRPVLFATREELREELRERGETWREDRSNEDVAFRRNRIRHELIPYLEQHFNPSVRAALARAAGVTRADHSWLERIASAATAGIVDTSDDAVRVDATRFRHLPAPIQRRVAMHVLALTQSRAPSFDDVTQFLHSMEHFDGKRVLVEKKTHAPFSLALPVPGMVQTEAGWIIEAETADLPRGGTRRPDVAQIDAAALKGGLVVRNRRPGDRIRPVGLGGRKKLQDVLVDRKVDRAERDAVPIVTDTDDRIIWVAGHVLGEEFRVTERTKGVIILKLRRI